MSAILDPPFWEMEIRCQICNQRPQKPWSRKFHENRWVSKILCPPYSVRHFEFRKSGVKFIISDSKASEYRVSQKSCGFQNCMSDILDIRHFAKGMAIWNRWDNSFLAVQLFRSPLIIVRIESQYSFGSKKNYEKKNSRFFGTFLQIWRHIGFPTGPNSILTADFWRAYPKL